MKVSLNLRIGVGGGGGVKGVCMRMYYGLECNVVRGMRKKVTMLL